MSVSLLGKKIGMTHLYKEDGRQVPVTVLKVDPHFVSQIKTEEKDGYSAVQLATVEQTKEKKVSKPLAGHFKKAGITPRKYLKESRDVEGFELGQEVAVAIFEEGERINVTGKSKGRGFAGVMKRHGFGGAPATRGTHEFFRHGGSIGNCEFPGRVQKGRKMAGRMGGDTITSMNVEVVKVYKEDNVILVKGGVPGARGCILELSKQDKG